MIPWKKVHKRFTYKIGVSTVMNALLHLESYKVLQLLYDIIYEMIG